MPASEPSPVATLTVPCPRAMPPSTPVPGSRRSMSGFSCGAATPRPDRRETPIGEPPQSGNPGFSRGAWPPEHVSLPLPSSLTRGAHREAGAPRQLGVLGGNLVPRLACSTAPIAMADRGRYSSGSRRAAAIRGIGGGHGPPPHQLLPLSHRDGRQGWGVRAARRARPRGAAAAAQPKPPLVRLRRERGLGGEGVPQPQMPQTPRVSPSAAMGTGQLARSRPSRGPCRPPRSLPWRPCRGRRRTG